MARYNAPSAEQISKSGWVAWKTSKSSIILDRARHVRKISERKTGKILSTLTNNHSLKFKPSSQSSKRFSSLPLFLHQIALLHMP